MTPHPNLSKQDAEQMVKYVLLPKKQIMTKTLIGLMIMIVLNVNGLAQNAGASQSSGKNQLSSNEKKEGWKTLFDGQSTAGWHSYGRAAAGPSWKVADGSIYYDTANEKTLHDRDLVTNNAYENYHIKYEWKIAPKGNSGFLFNVNEDTSKYKLTYVTGLEMQVIDNNGHRMQKTRNIGRATSMT
jgi:hypothetical protein